MIAFNAILTYRIRFNLLVRRKAGTLKTIKPNVN